METVMIIAHHGITPQIPPRSLVLGSPAKVVRPLESEEIEGLHRSADNYVRFAREYREQGIR
jgi:carbonic anhydrase/acetyltransferase-like protein (isoleucine patch superfamily)